MSLPDSPASAFRPSISVRPCRLRFALVVTAFLVAAISLRAGDSLSYDFAVPAKSARTERVIAISFSLSARDDGSYAAK